MKAIVTLILLSSVSSAMAAEVVRSRDGKWGCVEAGKLIKAGESGLWATNYPLKEHQGCAALTMPLPLRELKKGEAPTWLVFDPKGQSGKGAGSPKNLGF